MDVNEVKAAPEYVDWPGRGKAERQQPRGMSDYERGAGTPGHANYETKDKCCLSFRSGVRWQASYKCHSTKWFATPEEAIADCERRIREAQ